MTFSRHISFAIFWLCLASASAVADAGTDAIKSAWQALQSRQFPQAIEQYEKARELLPDNPEISYNLGVAHYRNGAFDKAAEAFQQAMTLAKSDRLRSHSIYNMGNAAYAQSLNALQQQGDPTKPAEQLDQATDLLKQAFENYKKAVDSNPNDADARANAELSNRLLKQLQELQEQMQQQQQQQSSDQDQQEQNDEQQPQQSSGQQEQQGEPQQQDQSQSDQSDQSQSQQDQSEQTNEEQQPQSADQEGEEQPQQQPEPQEIEHPETKEEQSTPQSRPSDGNEKQSMTREQADRLLQAVRDKELKRRAELARREAVKHAPVEKDW